MKALSGLEKAALLLKTVGPEAAQAVLDKLGSERAKRLRALMEQVGNDADRNQALQEVLRDLEAAVQAEKAAAASPPSPAQKIDRVVGDEPPAKKDASAEPAELPSDPLLALPLLAPEKLALAMRGENARTVSLILNVLDVERAGAIYKLLPSELRRDMSVLFASQAVPAPEVLRRIAQGIVQKTRDLKESALSSPAERVKKMANLLRLLERSERMDVLANLSERDPHTAQKVKDHLYQFTDLLLMDSASVQKLLGELDMKNLAMALKNAAPEILQKIQNNLSRRAQESLKDEMDLMGSPSSSRVEQARHTVIEAIQRLDERGELILLE